jgi:cold shock CspA family protein
VNPVEVRPRRGHVERFDASEGLGVVVDDGDGDGDGTRYPFHCVTITDGSRTIDPGQAVSFVVRPGLPGQWEACAVDRRSR